MKNGVVVLCVVYDVAMHDLLFPSAGTGKTGEVFRRRDWEPLLTGSTGPTGIFTVFTPALILESRNAYHVSKNYYRPAQLSATFTVQGVNHENIFR